MKRAAFGLALGLVAVSCTVEDNPELSPPSSGVIVTTSTEPAAANTTSTAGHSEEPSSQEYPDVIDVEVSNESPGVYRFTVTISSPYDSPQRYADAWRVVASDGSVLGIRELLHDHATEQPFTRSLNGVEIPPDVAEVTVEARDLLNGWGGTTITVPLP